MWINFRSSRPYALKIHVGGVNAISGEPVVETAATQLRRRNQLSQGKPIQDYVILPQQPWLDGVATSPGQVRQFVAMPIGAGYTMEAQITGSELTAGIQFEIIPAAPYPMVLRFQEQSIELPSMTFMSNTSLGKIFNHLGLGPDDRLGSFTKFGATSMAKTIEQHGLRDGDCVSIFREPTRSAGFDTRERQMTVQIDNVPRHGSLLLKVSPHDTCFDVMFLLEDSKTIEVNKYTRQLSIRRSSSRPSAAHTGLTGISTLASAGIKEVSEQIDS
jgi:hypothetical protein